MPWAPRLLSVSYQALPRDLRALCLGSSPSRVTWQSYLELWFCTGSEGIRGLSTKSQSSHGGETLPLELK